MIKLLKKYFKEFPRIFWIVNTLEGFERGAYYGTIAVLSWHVFYNLFPNYPNIATKFGILYGMLIFLLYFTPLISAALAEKYGYKKVLTGAFGILIVGYFLLFLVRPGQIMFLTFALIVMGIGAGAFKPIISATIAHVTAETQRNTAYAIYYWMINLGATIMPLTIGILFPEESLYYFVFLLSAFLISINLIITILFFTDPTKPQRELSVPDAIKRIIPALKDKKYVILLAIYSGFWFMFAIGHTFLPVYMMNFKRMPDWFMPPFLAVINPCTIIIVGPLLAVLVEKYKSLNVVMVGLIIFCVGLAIVGFSNSQFLFVTGIIVFSIGEFITHPGFIAHVSKIAPKKMVAIYMACIFLATGSGNIVGGVVQGVWYDYFAIGLHRPKVYFGLIISIGLFTYCCFVLYNRWMNRQILNENPKAKVETGFFTKPFTIIIMLIMIPVVISGSYMAGTNTFYEIEDKDAGVPEFDPTMFSIADGGSFDFSGTLAEQTSAEETVSIKIGEGELLEEGQFLSSITFTLTWQDEDDFTRLIRTWENQPDEFQLMANMGTNFTKVESGMNPHGGIGTITLEFEFEHELVTSTNGTGEWQIEITLLNCGNLENNASPIAYTDSSNDWELSVTTEILVRK